jgi:DNA-binding NarL/FixJ family response regulator
MFSVLIIDDHPAYCHGLKQVIGEEFPGTIYGEASNGDSALRQLGKLAWDLVILDMDLPGTNGLPLLQAIREQLPNCKVLLLTAHPGAEFLTDFLQLGAVGYLTKEEARMDLIRAFRSVMNGKPYPAKVPERTRTLNCHHWDPPHQGLSEREFSVMIALAEGKRPTDIARELDLSIKTVSTYKRRILDKMNMNVSAELTRYAIRSGLIAS